MEPQAGLNSLSVSSPRVVLDTNTVLAWLWFEDPTVAGLGAALQSGQIRWAACAAMRQELEVVTQALRPRLDHSSDVDVGQHVLRTFDDLAILAARPMSIRSLICTDPSDQMFIDLAVSQGARWLLSRDRAVLKLRRRAAARGICICPPEHWSMGHAGLIAAGRT